VGLNLQRSIVSCIGIDPGPTTGICFVDYIGMAIVGRTSIQVDGESGLLTLEAMMRAYYSDPETVVKRYAGIEAFVTGQGAGTKGDAADYTRQGVMKFAELLQIWGYRCKIRKKVEIWNRKDGNWASDKRLEKAGILRPPEMRHANDAGRHCLYTAVHDALRPDPLR
jgi:hypothetical protein